MWDKRIHVKYVGKTVKPALYRTRKVNAPAGDKLAATGREREILPASLNHARSFPLAASKVLHHTERINFSCAVLLLIAVMGGCSEMGSPWNEKGVGHIPVVAAQADLATFNEAVSMVESQRYEAAAAKFRQVFEKFAASDDHRQRAAESLFWIGFCREKQRRLDEARTIYMQLADEYAGTRASEEACKRRLRIRAD